MFITTAPPKKKNVLRKKNVTKRKKKTTVVKLNFTVKFKEKKSILFFFLFGSIEGVYLSNMRILNNKNTKTKTV